MNKKQINTENDESEKVPVRLEIASFYILENYSPINRIGYTDSDLITSAELVRELSEMASISISEISQLMWGAKFKMENSGGKIYWRVYRKE